MSENNKDNQPKIINNNSISSEEEESINSNSTNEAPSSEDIQQNNSNKSKNGLLKQNDEEKEESSEGSEINGQEFGFKIFLGGLPGTTKKEHIEEHFKEYGLVLDSVVVYDSSSNRPAGFGFVTLKKTKDIHKILEIDHIINETTIDCKKALDKDQARIQDEEERLKKIFVGGLPKNLPDKELYNYFVQFGELDKAYVVKDFKTGKTRGFGFVVFFERDGFKNAFKQKNHVIKGKKIHLRKTQTRKEMKEHKTGKSQSSTSKHHRPKNVEFFQHNASTTFNSDYHQPQKLHPKFRDKETPQPYWEPTFYSTRHIPPSNGRSNQAYPPRSFKNGYRPRFNSERMLPFDHSKYRNTHQNYQQDQQDYYPPPQSGNQHSKHFLEGHGDYSYEGYETKSQKHSRNNQYAQDPYGYNDYGGRQGYNFAGYPPKKNGYYPGPADQNQQGYPFISQRDIRQMHRKHNNYQREEDYYGDNYQQPKQHRFYPQSMRDMNYNHSREFAHPKKLKKRKKEDRIKEIREIFKIEEEEKAFLDKAVLPF